MALLATLVCICVCCLFIAFTAIAFPGRREEAINYLSNKYECVKGRIGAAGPSHRGTTCDTDGVCGSSSGAGRDPVSDADHEQKEDGNLSEEVKNMDKIDQEVLEKTERHSNMDINVHADKSDNPQTSSQGSEKEIRAKDKTVRFHGDDGKPITNMHGDTENNNTQINVQNSGEKEMIHKKSEEDTCDASLQTSGQRSKGDDNKEDSGNHDPEQPKTPRKRNILRHDN